MGYVPNFEVIWNRKWIWHRIMDYKTNEITFDFVTFQYNTNSKIIFYTTSKQFFKNSKEFLLNNDILEDARWKLPRILHFTKNIKHLLWVTRNLCFFNSLFTFSINHVPKLGTTVSLWHWNVYRSVDNRCQTLGL